MSDWHDEFLAAPLHTRSEVLSAPCPVPAAPGLYGWWFDRMPCSHIDASGCQTRDEWTLLYVGISPSKPHNAEKPSSPTLRKRVCTHCRGRAATSTLRLSLGSLLADELGLELRRVGTAGKRHFGCDEAVLSDWMSEHARVSCIVYTAPWLCERELIHRLDLPLNLAENADHSFHATLSQARSDAKGRADALPVLRNCRRKS
ncbi:GIY-YIG nuclease family protein [Gordonia insulae]|uniref:GIY-YIG nuclease family protein n=1 Tax=Gordonia insulae TaxID=2420509 RepID=UPI000F5C1DB3